MPNAKHRAGIICAPVYPGTRPALAKLVKPKDRPTARGPTRGPNSLPCRGSRATPYARNRSVKQENVSMISACPAAMVPGSRKQPPPFHSLARSAPKAPRSTPPARAAPRVWPNMYRMPVVKEEGKCQPINCRGPFSQPVPRENPVKPVNMVENVMS